MELFEPIRKALLAGLGMQDKVKEFVNDLVKKGELSESQGAKLVNEWSEKAKKDSKEVGGGIAEMLNSALKKMNLPTRDEMHKLDKKLSAISSRLKKIEEQSKEA